MADEIIELIERVPPYLCYIYPGYITMYLFHYFRALTLNETSAKMIKSIVISYLYIIAVNKCCIPFLNNYFSIDICNTPEGVGFNVMLLLLCVICPYVIYMVFFKHEFLQKIFKLLKIDTTIAKDEVDLLRGQYKYGIWIRVYMKNNKIIYSGSLTDNEMEIGKRDFFCLSKFKKFMLLDNGKERILEDHSNDVKEKVVIYLEQISHFESVNVDAS